MKGPTIPAGTSGFTPQANFSVAHDGSGFVDGATITITDSSSRFGSKPNGAKPYAWIDPATTGNWNVVASLSREPASPTYTADTPNGVSSTIKADNSTQSGWHEFGALGGGICQFDVGIGSPTWYIYEKKYYAMHIDSRGWPEPSRAWTLKTDGNENLLSQGDLIEGGASGVIARVSGVVPDKGIYLDIYGADKDASCNWVRDADDRDTSIWPTVNEFDVGETWHRHQYRLLQGAELEAPTS
jgi:hypothetical protein